jgi:single-stranded DNA-binding protein
MNSCSFVVKIVSNPLQKLVSNNIWVVETRVQFVKIRKKKSFDQFQIVLWGNLGKEFKRYYRIGDYVLIKGMLRLKRIKSRNRFKKETEMTVIKVYPFLLKH